MMYLNSITSSAGVQQRVELVVDLGLAGGADLVVRRARPGGRRRSSVVRHLVAQVGVVVDRRDREVAALVAGLVAAVAALLVATGVPGALDGVDVVVALVLVRLEADVVEDVELGLGAEEGGVGDAGGGQVGLGLGGDVARVAAVRLVGERVDDREVHRQRLRRAERVDEGGGRVGHAASCPTRGSPGSRGSTSRRTSGRRSTRRHRTSRAGTLKCCMTPGRSQNRTSMNSTPSSLTNFCSSSALLNISPPVPAPRRAVATT